MTSKLRHRLGVVTLPESTRPADPNSASTSNLFCRSCSFRSKTSSLRSPCARERLYSLSFWHCLRHVSGHSLWQSSGQIVNVLSDLRLTNLLTFYLALRHSFWHSFWHVFPTVFWRSFWYSFLLTQHAISHSVWHIFRRSLWHSGWLGVPCGILHCVCQGDVLSGISPGLLSGWPFSCCVRSDMVSDGWSDTLSRVRPDIFSNNLSGMSWRFFRRSFWHYFWCFFVVFSDVLLATLLTFCLTFLLTFSDICPNILSHSLLPVSSDNFFLVEVGQRTQEGRKKGKEEGERQKDRKEGRKERKKKGREEVADIQVTGLTSQWEIRPTLFGVSWS